MSRLMTYHKKITDKSKDDVKFGYSIGYRKGYEEGIGVIGRKFDYWMLEVIEEALKTLEKEKCRTTKGKRMFKENKNRYNPLGRIRVIEDRIQEIREVFDKEMKEALNYEKLEELKESEERRTGRRMSKPGFCGGFSKPLSLPVCPSKGDNMTFMRRTISITKEQDKWVEYNCISLSKLTQKAIESKMRKSL